MSLSQVYNEHVFNEETLIQRSLENMNIHGQR